MVTYPLFSNINTFENSAQVNDSEIQQWMEVALSETNEILREQLYDGIQRKIIEDLFPMAWLHQDKTHIIYLSTVKGLPLNNPFKFSFKDVKLH
jgi:ABC-type transport system substrate-binding protein